MLIFYEEWSKSAIISFIFNINPSENRWMMSDDAIRNEIDKLENFFNLNWKYNIELIKTKVGLTDYDYLEKYKSLKEKLKIDVWNKELHKLLIYWNGKLIQSKTKWTFKYEYYLKISVSITNLKDDKEILSKHKEIVNLLVHFPYIQWMLTSHEVILLILKNNRFFKEELISLSIENLIKEWII